MMHHMSGCIFYTMARYSYLIAFTTYSIKCLLTSSPGKRDDFQNMCSRHFTAVSNIFFLSNFIPSHSHLTIFISQAIRRKSSLQQSEAVNLIQPLQSSGNSIFISTHMMGPSISLISLVFKPWLVAFLVQQVPSGLLLIGVGLLHALFSTMRMAITVSKY